MGGRSWIVMNNNAHKEDIKESLKILKKGLDEE